MANQDKRKKAYDKIFKKYKEQSKKESKEEKPKKLEDIVYKEYDESHLKKQIINELIMKKNDVTKVSEFLH